MLCVYPREKKKCLSLYTTTSFTYYYIQCFYFLFKQFKCNPVLCPLVSCWSSPSCLATFLSSLHSFLSLCCNVALVKQGKDLQPFRYCLFKCVRWMNEVCFIQQQVLCGATALICKSKAWPSQHHTRVRYYLSCRTGLLTRWTRQVQGAAVWSETHARVCGKTQMRLSN